VKLKLYSANKGTIRSNQFLLLILISLLSGKEALNTVDHLLPQERDRITDNLIYSSSELSMKRRGYVRKGSSKNALFTIQRIAISP